MSKGDPDLEDAIFDAQEALVMAVVAAKRQRGVNPEDAGILQRMRAEVETLVADLRGIMGIEEGRDWTPLAPANKHEAQLQLEGVLVTAELFQSILRGLDA